MINNKKASRSFLSIIMGLKNIVYIFLFSLLGFTLAGQEVDTIQKSDADKGERTLKTLFSGPPGKAFLYSLILPGAGQAYNRRYWKIPIVYAAIGVTGYILIDNINTFNEYDKAYRLRVDEGSAADTVFPTLSDDQVRGNRELVRKNVQRSYVSLGLIYIIGAAEAFVDRHLMSFDMSDDLSLNVRLKGTPNGIGFIGSIVPNQSQIPPILLH